MFSQIASEYFLEGIAYVNAAGVRDADNARKRFTTLSVRFPLTLVLFLREIADLHWKRFFT